MRRPEKMLIYNLFPLLAGTFTGWERHMSRAADMGFNWLFVNPIQRLGSSRSLYSIADYMSINPAFVDDKSGKTPEEQLRDALRKAESLGLRAMVDLVINHCAVDSPLLREHPEWFVWEGHGRVANPSADEDGRRVVWDDLAKFDHRHTRDTEGLFRFFRDVVRYLIGLGFKGFRCDAAYQVLITVNISQREDANNDWSLDANVCNVRSLNKGAPCTTSAECTGSDPLKACDEELDADSVLDTGGQGFGLAVAGPVVTVPDIYNPPSQASLPQSFVRFDKPRYTCSDSLGLLLYDVDATPESLWTSVTIQVRDLSSAVVDSETSLSFISAGNQNFTSIPLPVREISGGSGSVNNGIVEANSGYLDAWHDGRNEVEVFVVEADVRGPTLRRTVRVSRAG